MKVVQPEYKNQNCFRVPAAVVTTQRTRIPKTTMELQMICIGWDDHDLFLPGTDLPVPAE